MEITPAIIHTTPWETASGHYHTGERPPKPIARHILKQLRVVTGINDIRIQPFSGTAHMSDVDRAVIPLDIGKASRLESAAEKLWSRTAGFVSSQSVMGYVHGSLPAPELEFGSGEPVTIPEPLGEHFSAGGMYHLSSGLGTARRPWLTMIASGNGHEVLTLPWNNGPLITTTFSTLYEMAGSERGTVQLGAYIGHMPAQHIP